MTRNDDDFVSRMWNVFRDEANRAGLGSLISPHYPTCDMSESLRNIIVRCDLPGIEKRDIQLEIDDREGVLSIAGERKEERKEESENQIRYERRLGAFERRMPIPRGVDPSSVQATYKDGVLSVVIPKPNAGPSGKKINVPIK